MFILRPRVSFLFFFKVVINGGATSSGDQDTEDTELMAIYTTENGIAEKVRGGSFQLRGHSCLSSSGFAWLRGFLSLTEHADWQIQMGLGAVLSS